MEDSAATTPPADAPRARCFCEVAAATSVEPDDRRASAVFRVIDLASCVDMGEGATCVCL